MREIIARIVCLLTVTAIVLLALRFAVVHNPPVPPHVVAGQELTELAPTIALPAISPATIDRGRAVYEELRCATCHSAGGEGNPRHPLDGVGKRRTATDLAEWIGGTGSAAEQLSAGTRRRKQAFQTVPPADREALICYLLSLPARNVD